MSDDIWLDLAEVKRRTRMSRSAIYAGIKAKWFPAPQKRGRQSLWPESVIQAHIAREIATLPKMGQSMGAREPDTKKPLETAA